MTLIYAKDEARTCSMIRRCRRMPSRDTKLDINVNVALLGSCGQGNFCPKSAFNPSYAFVELCLSELPDSLLASTYDQFDTIIAISLQEGLCETSSAVTSIGSALFIEPNRQNERPTWLELAHKQRLNSGQHSDKVGFVVLGPPSPDELSIVVTREWRISPLYGS